MGQIGIVEVDQASGAGSARLQAGAAVENDHQVFAEVLRLGLADAQALAGGHHQDDRNDSPGDPEHG